MLVKLCGDSGLNGERLAGIAGTDLRYVMWERNARLNGGALERISVNQTLYPRRPDPPFRDEAIRGKAAVQGTGRGAVLIVDIAAHDNAQTFDVEKCILEFERIEGPFNEIDPCGECIEPLLKFHLTAQPGVTPGGENAEHVAVKIRFAAGLQPRNAETKRDKAVLLKSAEDLAADLAGDDEEAKREEIEIFETPDLTLETDYFFELI